MKELRRVAVFDADLPTGLAMIRSLGRAGVAVTAFHEDPKAMGRHSRYVTAFRPCPKLSDTDAFVSWLAEELRTGRIDLIAPTSDSVMFHTAMALARFDGSIDVGHPKPDAILDCLLKQRFATALDRVGFSTPATSAPTSVEDAVAFGNKVGYPLVSKPRTHVGAGLHRGEIYHSEDELRAGFGPYDIGIGHSTALTHDPELAWPLLQELIDVPELEVVSVSGCLDADGEVVALHHSKKMRLWPPKLGIGTLFVSEERRAFTDHAVEAVKAVLGSGIFEFEVLVDPVTDEYWGIDLNPRAFGQLTLDIARGNDLPALWYESVTGCSVVRQRPPVSPPLRWQMAVPLLTDLTVSIATGPERVSNLRELKLALGRSSVGAVADWRDPLPGMMFNRSFLRHPGGLVRPYLSRG